MFPRPQNFAGWPAAFIGVFIAAAAAQSLPVGAGAVDLSSPRSALLSLDRSLEAGDIAAAKKCLAFSGDAQARNFDIAYTQLYAPLALMHAVQARFGPAAGKPFGLAPLEKSLDDLLAKAATAEIRITGDTAAIADRSGVNPSEETELTGIAFQKQNGNWKVTAGTFMTAAGDIPPTQQKFMQALRDATAAAVRQTTERLNKGDFKSAQEAFADYESGLKQAATLAGAAATRP